MVWTYTAFLRLFWALLSQVKSKFMFSFFLIGPPFQLVPSLCPTRVLEVFVTSLTLAEFESQVNKWFKLTVFFLIKVSFVFQFKCVSKVLFCRSVLNGNNPNYVSSLQCSLVLYVSVSYVCMFQWLVHMCIIYVNRCAEICCTCGLDQSNEPPRAPPSLKVYSVKYASSFCLSTNASSNIFFWQYVVKLHAPRLNFTILRNNVRMMSIYAIILECNVSWFFLVISNL